MSAVNPYAFSKIVAIKHNFNNFKNRDERNANVQSQCAFKKISTYAALQSLDNAINRPSMPDRPPSPSADHQKSPS